MKRVNYISVSRSDNKHMMHWQAYKLPIANPTTLKLTKAFSRSYERVLCIMCGSQINPIHMSSHTRYSQAAFIDIVFQVIAAASAMLLKNFKFLATYHSLKPTFKRYDIPQTASK